jgi:hypothetical protein
MLAFENGHCQLLPEQTFRTFFSLIVTPLIEFKSNGSCLYAQRLSDLPCKWYNLPLETQQATKSDQREYSWQIHELTHAEMPLRIPEHAGIVIQLPAEFIHGLQDTPQEERSVLNLPSIVLKKTVTQAQLDQATDQAALSAPDLNQTCSRPAYFKKKQGTSTLLIRKP